MKTPHALILSGGHGERFASKEPKQFALLKNKPILLHSLLAFLSWKKNIEICLVVPAQYAEASQRLVKKFLKKEASRVHFLHGAEKRHLSCLLGLEHILQNCQNEEEVILIHDAARPLVSHEEIDRLWKEILNSQCEVASLASPLSETIVRAENTFGPIHSSLERERLYAVKTPQAAHARTLKKMIEQSQAKDDFTDLLTWAEHCGIKGTLVEAEHYNWKITQEKDLRFLEAILKTAFNGNKGAWE